LGTYEEAPRKLQFGFRTNQENYHYDPSRTVTDGSFKYIRNYISHKPFCLRNLYQWGMPANTAWDEYVMSGNCKNPDWLQPYKAKDAEMLFDLKNDPWELNNLADDPKYKKNLSYFRKEIANHIRTTKDLGFFPREMRKTKENGLYQWVNDKRFSLEDMYKAAELASTASKNDIPKLLELLSSPHGEIRYWGTIGFCRLGSQGQLKHLPNELKLAMNDDVPEVASMAAEAACYLGEFDLGIKKLIDLFEDNFNPAYSSLETLTWYPEQKKMLKKYVATFQTMLEEQTKMKQDRMGLGVKIRSILVNLEALKLNELYTESDIEEGIGKNKSGRKFIYPSDIIK